MICRNGYFGEHFANMYDGNERLVYSVCLSPNASSFFSFVRLLVDLCTFQLFFSSEYNVRC